ncbi:hypothetical protein [Spirosoma horti]
MVASNIRSGLLLQQPRHLYNSFRENLREKFILEKIDGSVWITGRECQVPVVFDFTPSSFEDRTTVRLSPFDFKPLLDNINTNDLGKYLDLSFYTTNYITKPDTSPLGKYFIECLGKLWGLYKDESFHTPDLVGSFRYEIRFESISYQIADYGQLRVESYGRAMALLVESQDGDHHKMLACFGYIDGDMRGPSTGVLYGLARIEADQDIYNLFKSRDHH